MAEPARSVAEDVPSLDPTAMEREIALQRSRRRARLARRRARRLAHVRFWAVVVALFALSVFLTLTVWREIQRLFGL